LLALRKSDTTLSRGQIDGATLTEAAFLIRFFGDDGDDRLLVVNLGRDEIYQPCPEPLLAPPANAANWDVLWSSESVAYGGQGTPPLDTDKGWYFPGESAVLMGPRSRS
jgi:maltooligosyltrehalose trehalohydrolase